MQWYIINELCEIEEWRKWRLRRWRTRGEVSERVCPLEYLSWWRKSSCKYSSWIRGSCLWNRAYQFHCGWLLNVDHFSWNQNLNTSPVPIFCSTLHHECSSPRWWWVNWLDENWHGWIIKEFSHTACLKGGDNFLPESIICLPPICAPSPKHIFRIFLPKRGPQQKILYLNNQVPFIFRDKGLMGGLFRTCRWFYYIWRYFNQFPLGGFITVMDIRNVDGPLNRLISKEQRCFYCHRSTINRALLFLGTDPGTYHFTLMLS